MKRQQPTETKRGETVISRALALMKNGAAKGWSDALEKARKTV